MSNVHYNGSDLRQSIDIRDRTLELGLLIFHSAEKLKFSANSSGTALTLYHRYAKMECILEIECTLLVSTILFLAGMILFLLSQSDLLTINI